MHFEYIYILRSITKPMLEKFKDIYRIETTRLKGWDYTKSGKYFVIICTYRREEFFGHIINGKMILNSIGKIVKEYCKEIPKHFKNVKLDEYVIMPDHIHGIIIKRNKRNAQTSVPCAVKTRHASSLHRTSRTPLQCEIQKSVQRRISSISPNPDCQITTLNHKTITRINKCYT